MIRIAQADITTLSVDAIVNAARMAAREAMFFSPAENAEVAEGGGIKR